jgi:hypothetical protein
VYYDVTTFFTEYTKAQRRGPLPQHCQQSRRRPSTPAIFRPADGQPDTRHPSGFRGSHKQSHKRPCYRRGGPAGSNPRRYIFGESGTSIARSRSFRTGDRTATVLVVGKQQCLRRQPRLRTTQRGAYRHRGLLRCYDYWSVVVALWGLCR